MTAMPSFDPDEIPSSDQWKVLLPVGAVPADTKTIPRADSITTLVIVE